MPRSRPRLALLLLAVAVQLVVLYAPGAPGAAAFPGADKLGHAAVFGAVVLTGLRAGLPPRWVVGLSLLHAPVSEAVQLAALPGRAGDWTDVVADVVGVALGVLAHRFLARGQRRRPRT